MIEFKGRQIPETLAEILAPAHTVLLVHELLNDFCAVGGKFDKAGRRLDASGILPATVETIAAARAAGVRVIYIRYTRHTDYSSHSDPAIRKAWAQISGDPVDNLAMATVEGTWAAGRCRCRDGTGHSDRCWPSGREHLHREPDMVQRLRLGRQRYYRG